MCLFSFKVIVLIGLISSSICSSFSGLNDEKFFKKYAMMKIYQSCYGNEVMTQIQGEMKKAYEKCSQKMPQSSSNLNLNPNPNEILKQLLLLNRHNSNIENQLESVKIPQPILSSNYLYQQLHPHGVYNYIPGNFIDLNNAMYAHYLQNPQYPINQFPIKNTRFSKEMKIDNTMASAVVDAVQTGKTHNVTCIMYELGYINDKLEPDYERISDNIQQLDISGSLKSDLLEGVEFCQQFSEKNAPLSQDLQKPHFFLRCYKHKKLEACMMKDIRDRMDKISDRDDGDIEHFYRNGKRIKEQTPSIFDQLFSSLPIDDFETYF